MYLLLLMCYSAFSSVSIGTIIIRGVVIIRGGRCSDGSSSNKILIVMLWWWYKVEGKWYKSALCSQFPTISPQIKSHMVSYDIIYMIINHIQFVCIHNDCYVLVVQKMGFLAIMLLVPLYWSKYCAYTLGKKYYTLCILQGFRYTGSKSMSIKPLCRN